MASSAYLNSGPYLLRPDKVLYGTGGDDYLYGSWGNDRLYGFDGNDNLFGGDGTDRLYGGWGHDNLYGDDGNDTLYGEEGFDFLNGGLGNDVLYGGADDDTLWGDNGAQAGSDTLFGQAGNDFLFGGASADFLDGGDGNDRLRGDSGNDVLVGGNGFDHVWGGAGADTILETGVGGDFIYLFQGDSFAFTGYADTIHTGSDWSVGHPWDHMSVIVVTPDVVGTGPATGYTNATTIEDAAAEAGWQIANWNAEKIADLNAGRSDNFYSEDVFRTHAVYLYNAAQDQGYLAIDMDVDGSYETGIIFTGLSLEEYEQHYYLIADDML